MDYIAKALAALYQYVYVFMDSANGERKNQLNNSDHLKIAIDLLKSNGKLSQAYLMRKMRVSAVEANRIIKEIYK